jgi:glycosyltransferase involved in cell wall biosynthesis
MSRRLRRGSNLPELQPPANNVAAARQASPVNLFLMTNSFETGGSERQFAVMAQNLAHDKFQVSLGCILRLGPFASAFGDVPEFRLGGSLYSWTSIRARLRLAALLRERQIHVAHAFDFYTNLTLIPAARLARVPVVIGSQRQLGDLLTPRQSRAQAAALRWCDGVVCNSQAAADGLARRGLPSEKLFIIGNALPEQAFSGTKESVDRRRGGLRVGMVARMNAHSKNHAGFLRIASRIHSEMPEVEFLLAGDGPLRPELEKQAQDLGLENHVVFLGDRKDIPDVLASMDIAVLTSDSESLSNALLEAMAAGLPVVAYHVGGNAELVNQERGLLIPAGDEERFAAAVLRLLALPAMRLQLGQNGRQFARENFSLERILAQYEACYETLLEKKGMRNSLATWRPTTEVQRND